MDMCVCVCVCVCVCAEMVCVMWMSEQYRVINVHIRRMASVNFGSYVHTYYIHIYTYMYTFHGSNSVS